MKKNKHKTNFDNKLSEFDETKYKAIFKKQFTRLLFTYLLPLIFLAVFFHFEYRNIISESEKLHLKSIAVSQAQMLDLFLRERIVNLINLADNPQIEIPPSSKTFESYLLKLKRDSDAFIDLGYFDSIGIQKAYIGPLPTLLNKDYSKEKWFKTLKENDKRYVITDIYLGFRNRPHFTIAVKRQIDRYFVIFRATLDPEKIYKYVQSVLTSKDVITAIINIDGYFQLAHQKLGNLLEKSPFFPPKTNQPGISIASLQRQNTDFGYCWLTQNEWCVVAIKEKWGETFLSNFETKSITASLIVVAILVVVITYRSKKIVESEKEKELAEREKNIAKLQLEHASKLATVGELASGIAHEINNPLAIIASEAGLIKDLLDPQFDQNVNFEELIPHLNNIQTSAFRARDITRKLMSFVRREEYKLDFHNVNDILEELIQGFIENDLYVSNIKLIKNFSQDLPKTFTDANSLKQVILNLISNARDAITPPGTIFISTQQISNEIHISIKDTGCGISQEQMSKIFMPFFTTKEVGKGTELGLSVSYNIIRNLGGRIEVESLVGFGSTFTIVLPITNTTK